MTPIYKLVDVNEVKLTVASMTLSDLKNFIKSRKGEEVTEVELGNGCRKMAILKSFDPSEIPISYLPTYVYCPCKLMNAVKLGEELGLSDKMVKLVTENHLRRLVFGDLLHEYFVSKLIEKYGEDIIQSEVYVERNVFNKFKIRGRCDIVTIIDDELSVVEIKSRINKDINVIQVSAYAHCLDTKSLYLCLLYTSPSPRD